MKSLLLVFLLLAFSSAYEEEDSIIVLNDENFHTVVKSFKMIMVAFYAPWCQHCKDLLPEYVRAAALIKDLPEPVKLAKIDATVNPKIAEEYKITAFPTIKLFYDNGLFDYTKLRKAEEIISYIKSKQRGSIEKFSTVKQVEDFKANSTVPILFSTIDEGEAGYLDFKIVALLNERLSFAECISSQCKTRYQAPILMLTKFDEKEVKFTDPITQEALNHFIEIYSIELGGLFNDYASDAIFDFNKTSLFYFRSESDPNRAQNDALMKTIAKDFREQFYIFVQDIEGEAEIIKQSANYFFVKRETLPQIQMVNVVNEDDVRMHIMKETPINEITVRKFIRDYFDGKIPKEPLSELIYEEDRDMSQMEKLAGRNYVEKAIQSTKSYFVLLYILGEPKGKDLFHIWNDLNEKYKDSQEVTFAGIDLSENEVENVTKDQVPLMRLYVQGDKQNPRDYTGDSVLINIEEWMATQLGWTRQATESIPEGDKKKEL